MTGKKRMAVDAAMTVLLYLLMAYHYTGQMWHEIAGTAMTVLFIAHNLINRCWYLVMGKGRYTAARIFQTTINLLLLIDVVLLACSGIAMSHYVFRFLSLPVSMMLARSVHLIAAHLGFLLMSMHIGLHAGVILGRIRNRSRKGADAGDVQGNRPEEKPKEEKTGTVWLLRLLAVVIVFYGVYALHERNFLGYITGQSMFAYFDYSELPVWFFLDYAAIMGGVAVIAYCVQQILRKGLRFDMKAFGEHLKKHKVGYLILLGILLAAAVWFFAFGRTYIRRHFRTVSVNRVQATKLPAVDMGDKKGIIIYFTRVGNTNFDADVDATSSASLMEENGTLIGNSELLAEMVANATGYPTYAITVQKKYSSSYTDTVSEANDELKNNTRSELVGELPDMAGYDSIYLVYPLWWGTLPMPVRTFLEQTDLEGKAIYSLVTHGGSEFGNAFEDTKNYTEAEVSNQALAIYDDDVTGAARQVAEWLENIRR